MKFAEHQGRIDYEPWSIRQYALFHVFDSTRQQSVYILISSTPRSQVETHALEWMRALATVRHARRHPLWPNEILWQCYLDNWRPYMTFYEEALQNLVR